MASTRAKTKAAVGVVGYLVWGLFAYHDLFNAREKFYELHLTVVLGVVALLLRDLPPPVSPPRPPRKEPPP